jgi:hypothetical protein
MTESKQLLDACQSRPSQHLLAEADMKPAPGRSRASHDSNPNSSSSTGPGPLPNLRRRCQTSLPASNRPSAASPITRAQCVVFAVPQLKYAVSHTLLVAHRRHIPDDFLRLSRADALAQHRDMEREVRAIAQRSGLRVADPKDALCDQLLYLQGRRPVTLLRRQSLIGLRRVVCGAHARAMLRGSTLGDQ